MRKNSYEYRVWKKKQNAKNLKRRTKRRKTQQEQINQHNNYNKNVKSLPEYDSKRKRFSFHAPLFFSIADNPDETLHFFHDIISFITNRKNYGKTLFIDISNVTKLKTDALMYLLSIVNNLDEKYRGKYNFFGNAPIQKDVFARFVESGFYNYVQCEERLRHVHNNDNIQIVYGENCNTSVAKRISDFVCEKAKVSKKECRFLYNIMIELMSNTHKHAYNDSDVFVPRWYCFAEFDLSSTITFTFMDTGSGIPSTVQKNFAERIDFLKIKGQNRYVISALNGDFRTATKQEYRGKGLPKIREYCTNGLIRKMHIVANKADVNVFNDGYDGKDLFVSLRGTLYCWQIDIPALKGEST